MKDAPPDRGLQLVVFAGEETWTLDLPATGTIAIGRARESALRIEDPSVSRNHALLQVGPPLAIEDLGGPNGTMIRSAASVGTPGETLNVRRLLGQRADLGVGDTILFGTTCVVVRHQPPVPVPDLSLLEGTVIRDASLRAVYEHAARIAPTPISALILGETGVGKEVLARAIHASSTRAQSPFLGINCAAISETLLDSELFGHEKGAFTGAHQARAGLFEAAAGGTVFLDEVGELSPSIQGRLLRALGERVVTRLGSNRARPIDVRVVAATNRDLEADMKTGRFREDLYFRLNGTTLTVPPLRERPRDIRHLAEEFVGDACRMVERAASPTISEAAFERLASYRWPGNVRELRSAIELAVVLCAGATILPEHLPPTLNRPRETAPAPSAAAAMSSTPPEQRGANVGTALPTELESMERERITAALDRCAGNQSEAARMLGMSRGSLILRIKRYGLRRPRSSTRGPEA